MPIDLQQQAKRHLWMHFTRMGSYADAEVPVIVRRGDVTCRREPVSALTLLGSSYS